MRLTLFASLCALVISCSQRQHEQAELTQAAFESVYMELLDSVAVGVSASNDSVLSPSAIRILQRHSITLDDFKSTVRSYSNDPQRWKEFYENVTRKIDIRDSVSAAVKQANR